MKIDPIERTNLALRAGAAAASWCDARLRAQPSARWKP
jgi:hypothetical protein